MTNSLMRLNMSPLTQLPYRCIRVLGDEQRRRKHADVAMVTHDPVAAIHADRILFLADGRIVRDAARSSAEEISAYMLSMEVAA